MPEINLLLWLTLILLAVVAGYLLVIEKNAEEAAGRKLRSLAAEADARDAHRRPSRSDDRFLPDPTQDSLPRLTQSPRQPAVFFPVGMSRVASDEKGQQHGVYSFELPRLVTCDKKMAAVSDCHHCA
ncbi:MAG: hypothetical protein SCM11_18010 [Bacillota bacterium]|nr:hypothetical protein [Bacillota bacterium]